MVSMVSRTEKKVKFTGFFHLIRPFTLIAPFVVSVSIMIASYVHTYHFLPTYPQFILIILPASLSFVFLNAASNALNQATDVSADQISKPYRPLPQGIITKHEAIIISIIFYSFAFIFGLIIHLWFLLFLVFIAIFTVTYSLYPRMKDRLWFNQLWIAVPRGFLAILASWVVFGSILEPIPLIIGCISGLFLFGGSITKDLTDQNADDMVGTKTLINCYGVQKAACMVLPFLFFPFLFIPIFINNGLLPVSFWGLTFLAIPSFLTFRMMIRHHQSNCFFENTKAWVLMYLTYFCFAISFSALTVAGVIL
jgi:4-hydroxybenzoate polyprenyltransferase